MVRSGGSAVSRESERITLPGEIFSGKWRKMQREKKREREVLFLKSQG